MQEQDKNTGHDYDGIQELDNRLPSWWLATFYGAIAFSVVYFFYYVLGDGPTLVKEYERSKAEAEYSAYLSGGAKKVLSEDELLAIAKDNARRKQGAEVFQARCVACHGNQGQGGIGPNLVDDYWVHGGKLVQVVKTITDGVADKGMPPWGPVLKDEEISSLAAYIRSIRGTNPPGAKAPQGEKTAL